MRINVIYEQSFQIGINKAFDLTLQWLNSQYKAKIKKSTPPTYIEAKQGTMMTNTGHDPNWKKRIGISFYSLPEDKTLVRVETTPLARNIFRIEKLKQSWYNGLFSHLFSTLKTIEVSLKQEELSKSKINTMQDTKYCPNCGKLIERDTKICPVCGIEIK